MVRPRELVEAVLYTLQQSGDFPDSTNFVGYQPDINSESIKLPLVEVSTGPTVEVSEMNTDFIRFKKDADGNDIGRIYESLYTLDLDIAVWTAHGSKYSPRKLSDSVRDNLYTHETGGPSKPLQNPDGSPVDEVWRFSVEDGEQTDDLNTSPTLRRWQQTAVVSASERYVTDGESPVQSINLTEDTS